MKRSWMVAGVGFASLLFLVLLVAAIALMLNAAAGPPYPGAPTAAAHGTINLHPDQRKQIYDRLEQLADARSPLYEQEALAAMQSGDFLLPTGVLGNAQLHEHIYTERIEVVARQMAQTNIYVKRELALVLRRRTAHQRETIDWLLAVVAEPGVADHKQFAADALLNNQSSLSETDLEHILQHYRYQSVDKLNNQYAEKQTARFRELLAQRRRPEE